MRISSERSSGLVVALVELVLAGVAIAAALSAQRDAAAPTAPAGELPRAAAELELAEPSLHAALAPVVADRAAALPLAGPGSVLVLVRDAEGRPVDDAGFVLQSCEEDDTGSLSGRFRTHLRSPDGVEVEGRTDASGAHVFDDLDHGRWRVWAGTWKHDWVSPEPIVAGGESLAPPVVVELEPLPNDLLIEGIVVDRACEGSCRPRLQLLERVEGRVAASFPRSGPEGKLLALASRPGAECLLVATCGQAGTFACAAQAVMAGSVDVEVRIEPARACALDVRSGAGVPVAGWSASVEVLRLAEWVAPRFPTDERFAQNLLVKQGVDLALPQEAFRLRVHAPGMNRETFGPFDPREVGASIELTLQRTPVLSGQVLADGRAVEGVPIRGWRWRDLESGPRVRQGLGARTTTDADGWFELVTSADGTLWLECADARFGCVSSREFQADGVHDMRQIAIDLPPPGSIGGTATLPEGEDPTHWLVVFEPLDRGEPGAGQLRDPEHHVRLGEDRSYDSGVLGPGSWRVTLARGEHFIAYRLRGRDSIQEWGLPSFRSWAVGATPIESSVSPGRRTELDLDAVRPSRLRIRGRVALLDDLPEIERKRQIPGCCTVYVEQPDATLSSVDGSPTRVSTGRLDPDGRFELGAHVAGRYALSVHLQTRADTSLELERELDLERPDATWDRTLELGRLRIALAPSSPVSGVEMTLRSGEGTTVSGSLRKLGGAKEAAWVGDVPAGSVELELRSGDGAEPARFQVLVPAGGEVSFTPPTDR